VVVLSVPMTFPPQPVNGAMVAGMLSPGLDSDFTYPTDLKEELVSVLGEYIIHTSTAFSKREAKQFLADIYRVTENRLQAAKYLMSKYPWDFFMVVFNGTDTIQHGLWKFMDPAHPLHVPGSVFKDAILQFYKRVDEALAEILAIAGDDVVVAVMSDHGAGPLHRFFHTNTWLYRQGLMSFNRSVQSQLKLALFRLGMDPIRLYNRILGVGLGRLKRYVVRGKGRGLMSRIFLSYDDVDWSRTVAYAMGNLAGQIYLNVRDREPEGIVEPGAEYESVRDEIIERLKRLTHPETGMALTESVYRREELYSGAQVERAPDIVFLFRGLETAAFGEYEFASSRILDVSRGISGTHRLDGVFILCGPNVKRGHCVSGAHITDLAPTLLHLLGIPIPSNCDGHVLVETLTPEYLAAHPIRGAENIQSLGGVGGEVFTSGEQEQVTQRLRGLGYVA